VSRLPVLALPFLADGVFMLYGKIRQKIREDSPNETVLEGDEPGGL
jgi:hypothetical protein